MITNKVVVDWKIIQIIQIIWCQKSFLKRFWNVFKIIYISILDIVWIALIKISFLRKND